MLISDRGVFCPCTFGAPVGAWVGARQKLQGLSKRSCQRIRHRPKMVAAMARLLLPLAACLPLASGGAGSSSFVCSRPAAAAGATPPTPTLTLDTGTGAYTLHLAGAGSSLPSAPYRVLHGGRWLNSTAGEGLELHSRTARSGSDQHGE